jgi:cell wall-associated NlpC family hydrolase
MFYFKRTLGLIIGTGLVCTFGTPAYGIDFQSSNQVEVQKVKTDSSTAIQTLKVSRAVENINASRDSFVVMTEAETIQQNTTNNQSINYSSIPGNAGLLGAAMAQLGVYQDCTSLVENSLRAIGFSVPDLGPMGFVGYGVRIDPSEAQPGDIMMRGGHVAIYAGGAAIHGGFNGSTVLTTQDSDPYSYSVIVRVG